MMPKINPRELEKAMRRMGIQQQSLEATEVIVKMKDKELIVRNPNVVKVNMMGEETLQITGRIEERETVIFTAQDVKMVAEQAGCDEDKARAALEETGGDIAAAILKLKG